MKKSLPSFRKYGQITRADVQEGLLEEMIAESEHQGYFRRLPEPERDKSRWDILSLLPKGKDVWLYAYGSLIWSPMIEYSEKRRARLFGFHRQFCMWTKIGRGTPDCPGLTLALEPGGSNRGIAYRIPTKIIEQELKIIWNREMIGGSYVPKIVKLHIENEDKKVSSIYAIAFVMNRTHENYTGKLAPKIMAEAIAKAEGPLGKCADYLFNTVIHLDKLGLTDHKLSKLMQLVQAIKN
jgi:cation transport protein ChaC